MDVDAGQPQPASQHHLQGHEEVAALPFSSIDSTHPEDLWNWMDGQRKAGNELLAISHNANLSDGVMFPLEVDSKGRPIDAAWAQDRM